MTYTPENSAVAAQLAAHYRIRGQRVVTRAFEASINNREEN